ncbi:DUF7519 family protein [Candidatus Halobonum tyrrellensis]|uniref:DUF7519 family protein n=1 Tax=Candidatus Halobonum tyrrellensis TaxID=1431545 RepID=UPI000677DC6A|nr:hypothetical protein [Candidatus Halobonum tyrrellensis]
MTVTRRPPTAGVAAATAAAALTVAATALFAVTAGGVAAAGFVLVLAGLLRPSGRLLGYGAAGQVLAVLLAGVSGAGPGPLLVGGVGAALAWDLGDHALGLGEQLGRETDATRNVAVHAAASVAVGSVSAAVAFGVYTAAAGGQPLVALVFLLVGVVALASALR